MPRGWACWISRVPPTTARTRRVRPTTRRTRLHVMYTVCPASHHANEAPNLQFRHANSVKTDRNGANYVKNSVDDVAHFLIEELPSLSRIRRTVCCWCPRSFAFHVAVIVAPRANCLSSDGEIHLDQRWWKSQR